MELYYLFKGLLLGLSIAAPVGPLGVLCIRRTLTNGMLNGFITGLGAATADSAYGFIAAFGVTMISAFLLSKQIYLHLLGGFFLLYLGYKTFKSQPLETALGTPDEKNILGAYISAFLLTITNPMTIISFAAVFAGLGIGSSPNHFLAYFLVFGIFTGSALWWLILSTTVNLLRTKFDPPKLKWVNRFSGLIILGFGVISFITVYPTAHG